jgi:hypothetical protein
MSLPAKPRDLFLNSGDAPAGIDDGGNSENASSYQRKQAKLLLLSQPFRNP